MLASCGTEDRQMIEGHLDFLRTERAEVKETLEHKAAAHELLTEQSDVRTVAEERIVHVQERLKDDSLTVDEIEELRSDLSNTTSQLMELESRHVEMEAVFNEASIEVKDHEMETAVDVRANVKLLACVEKEDKKLKVCAEIIAINSRLQETDSELIKLKEVYSDDVESLASSLQVLNYVFTCLYSAPCYLYIGSIIFILAVFIVYFLF